MKSLIAVLLWCLTADAATIISGESRLDFPPSASFNKVVNDQPRDGEMVFVNPPRFSWFAGPSVTNLSADVTRYAYRFQVAYEPTFTNPVVNVVTPINAWNFVGPLTNNLVGSNIVYWRVMYLATNLITGGATYTETSVTSDFVTNTIGFTRSFVVSPSAAIWDRSQLADPTYWTNMDVHPRLWFNAATRPGLSNWLRTNTISSVQVGWGQITNQAYSAITNSWWTLTNPTAFVDHGTWASRVASVAFTYQMTGDPIFITEPTNVCQRASDLAYYIEKYGYDFLDTITFQSHNVIYYQGFIYDWLYNEFSTEQRSRVLRTIERFCRGALVFNQIMGNPACIGGGDCFTNDIWQYWIVPDPLSSTNLPATSRFILHFGNVQKVGSDHPPVWGNEYFSGALAAYGDSSWARAFCEQWLNLSISRPVVYSVDGMMNQGRGYAAEFLFSSGTLLNAMITDLVFPVVQGNKNPYWAETMDWWSRMTPVGMDWRYEPWGDLGQGGNRTGYPAFWAYPRYGRDGAAYLSNGVYMLHFLNASNYSGGEYGNDIAPERLPILYQYPLPQLSSNAIPSKVFEKGGMVFGADYGENVPNAYSQGCGFILRGSPMGHTSHGHDHPSDLNFLLWAYGVTLTDSAYDSSSFSKVSFNSYIPAFNGYGLMYNNDQLYPYCSRIIAFTNASEFTYAAVDGKHSFPWTTFNQDSGMLTSMGTYNARHRNGEAAALQMINRHVLYRRSPLKYFLIYDDWAAETNSIYSFIYHVPSASYNYTFDAANGRFSYVVTNETTGSNCTVIVKSMGDPSTLVITNLQGTNIWLNPVTGDNYNPYVLVTSPTTNIPTVLSSMSIYYGGASYYHDIPFLFTNTVSATNHVLIGITALETITNLFHAMTNCPATQALDYTWESPSAFRITIKNSETARCGLL
jgi:hypothetical protein